MQWVLKAAEAPDIIEALLDKDTAEDAKKGASEAGRPLGTALELRGVQGWVVTHAGERLDTRFEGGWSFSDRACFFADFR